MLASMLKDQFQESQIQAAGLPHIVYDGDPKVCGRVSTTGLGFLQLSNHVPLRF